MLHRKLSIFPKALKWPGKACKQYFPLFAKGFKQSFYELVNIPLYKYLYSTSDPDPTWTENNICPFVTKKKKFSEIAEIFRQCGIWCQHINFKWPNLLKTCIFHKLHKPHTQLPISEGELVNWVPKEPQLAADQKVT